MITILPYKKVKKLNLPNTIVCSEVMKSVQRFIVNLFQFNWFHLIKYVVPPSVHCHFSPLDGGTTPPSHAVNRPLTAEEEQHPGSSVVKMALSMCSPRMVAVCRTFKGISSLKPILSVNCPGSLLQTASYNPKPLKINIKEPYVPNKNSEKTPEWQKTRKYDRKVFGRVGSASGIEPASLWPSHEELDQIIADENEWHPPLEVMLKNIAAREEEETKQRLARSVLLLPWFTSHLF